MRGIPVKGVKSESSTTQSLLREATQKKIAYLLSKHTIKDVDVYVVIKDFFKEYLHAHYEFTFDELAKELDKTYIEKHIKQALYHLLEDFSTIEYKDEEIPQEVLHDVLKTFSKLVDDLIKQQAEKKEGFLNRLFGKKEEALPSKPDVQKKEEKTTPARSAKKPPTDLKKEERKESPKEEKGADIDDIDVPKPKDEDTSTVDDGFQIPSITQETPAAPPTDFGEEEKDEAAPRAEEKPVDADKTPDQSSAFPDEDVPSKQGDTESTGWTENAEQTKHQEEKESDEAFPFADENEDLRKADDARPNSEEEDALLQQQDDGKNAPAQEPAPKSPSEEDILAATHSDEQSKAPIQQQPSKTIPEQATKEAPVPEKRQAPVEETPASKEQKAPPQGKEKSEAYFGSEEEELSNDLNKLAQQLDEVIHDDDLKPQGGALMQADDLNTLVTEAERLAVEKKFDEAQNVYKELVGRYHELPEDDKHQYYDKVQHLYELLQRH